MSYKPVIRIAGAAYIFVFVYVFVILVPTAYIAFTDYYTAAWYELGMPHYRYAAKMSLAVAFLFFVFWFLGYFSGRVVLRNPNGHAAQGGSGPRARLLRGRGVGPGGANLYRLSAHRTVFIMAVVGVVLVWIAFLMGGYQKIALFGQDISKQEYRLMGFSEGARTLTAILQVARRLVLPFCVVYFAVLSGYTGLYSKKSIMFLILSLIVGILITLDRGPFMMFIVMFAYIAYCRSVNLRGLLVNALILFTSVFIVGGVVTFIQHNIQSFTALDVVTTGYEFILNRVLMAPNFVPIELSYGIFDWDTDKLWLRYARLTALLTGEYVGTLQENSIYVGPVGAVADIWRNMGIVGIVLIGFALGLYFYVIETLIRRSDPVMQVAASFTVITLVFYFVYGTFFSQGVFLQMIFIYVVLKMFSSDGVPVSRGGGGGAIVQCR